MSFPEHPDPKKLTTVSLDSEPSFDIYALRSECDSSFSLAAGFNVYEAMRLLKARHLDIADNYPEETWQHPDPLPCIIAKIAKAHRQTAFEKTQQHLQSTLQWAFACPVVAVIGGLAAAGPVSAGLVLGAIVYTAYKAISSALQMLGAIKEKEVFTLPRQPDEMHVGRFNPIAIDLLAAKIRDHNPAPIANREIDRHPSSKKMR